MNVSFKKEFVGEYTVVTLIAGCIVRFSLALCGLW
jgi:hypothetical protein